MQTTEVEESALVAVETPPEVLNELAIVPLPPAEAIGVEVRWLRLAFTFEFLLALLVALELWTQVGGQGHMDMLPWYLKLSFITVMAWFTVKLTASIMAQPKTWNRRSKFWLMGVLAIGAVMGGITFYYHLHEVTDQPDTDENASTSVRNIVPTRPPSRL